MCTLAARRAIPRWGAQLCEAFATRRVGHTSHITRHEKAAARKGVAFGLSYQEQAVDCKPLSWSASHLCSRSDGQCIKRESGVCGAMQSPHSAKSKLAWQAGVHFSAACKASKDDLAVLEDNVATAREDSRDAAIPGWTDPGDLADKALPQQPPADLTGVNVPLGSVVKVFTVSVGQNYFLPWQSHGQRELTGSGFVIDGKRIITNAHVVDDYAFVLVRKHGHPTKYKAKVEAVSHECDLAILRVDEDSDFWTGLVPLELASEGELPLLHENVSVVGYPSGGDSISVTGGVVSRMELIQYTFGGTNLLAIQIDAAINPGNSGGPVFLENKVVGVAFQCLPDADNIGYIIPVPVVRRFLADVAINGEPKGFCAMGIRCQSLESHQMEHPTQYRYLKA
eukprot:jgi/Mesvir1/12774/Mv22830-RA.2